MNLATAAAAAAAAAAARRLVIDYGNERSSDQVKVSPRKERVWHLSTIDAQDWEATNR
jgi:hypothetical protein